MDIGRSREVTDQVPGTIAFPQVGEVGGEAGEGGIEVLADLAADQGGLEDEIAAMANKELQGLPCIIEGGLDQGKAVAAVQILQRHGFQ